MGRASVFTNEQDDVILTLLAEYDGKPIPWGAIKGKYPLISDFSPDQLSNRTSRLRTKLGMDENDENFDELINSISNAIRRCVRKRLAELEEENKRLTAALAQIRHLLK